MAVTHVTEGEGETVTTQQHKLCEQMVREVPSREGSQHIQTVHKLRS